MIGPSRTMAIPHVKQRMIDGCKQCDCCGGNWHFNAPKRQTSSPSINVGGRVMAVRKAAWIALIGKHIKKGMRISSKCSNQHCINPELLVQVTAGKLLSMHYTVFQARSRHKASAHLMKYTKERTLLSEEDVARIRYDDRKGTEAAHEYGITKDHYNAIQRGDARVSRNPFSGLGAR